MIAIAIQRPPQLRDDKSDDGLGLPDYHMRQTHSRLEALNALTLNGLILSLKLELTPSEMLFVL